MEKGNVAGLAEVATGDLAATAAGAIEKTTTVTTVLTDLGEDVGERVRDKVMDKLADAAIEDVQQRAHRSGTDEPPASAADDKA